MNRDRFLFFENFKTTADKLPDDLRLKFYDALTDYVFNEVEPDDTIIAALISALKPSLDKEDGRANNGGKRENAGRKSQKIESEKSNLINSNQSFSNNNQSFQFLSETETRNGNKKQEDNIPPSEDKSSSVGIFSADAPKKNKKLVPFDWQPEEVVAQKLKDRGLDVPKVVEKFVNSCHAKGLKYVDFNRAILAWDWSKDESLKFVDEEKCWF